MKENYLAWDDLADLYGERTGGSARTRPMDDVFAWAVKQDDIEETKDGYLTMVEKEVREPDLKAIREDRA